MFLLFFSANVASKLPLTAKTSKPVQQTGGILALLFPNLVRK